MTYAVDDGDIIFSTWENSDAVRNTRRDGVASVLIDKADQPYAGVHYNGHACVLDDDITAEQYGDWFQRYIGDHEQAVESYNFLVGLGIGERAFIRFHPITAVTWDFAKIPGSSSAMSRAATDKPAGHP
jgi:hypothetical protein